jgi:hypothetical protein
MYNRNSTSSHIEFINILHFSSISFSRMAPFMFYNILFPSNTLSFWLVLKVYIDFLYLFGLANFLFLCTHVFFQLAFNHLVCITYHLTQSFKMLYGILFYFLNENLMLVWEFAFLSKKTLCTTHNHFLFVTTGKNFAPQKNHYFLTTSVPI